MSDTKNFYVTTPIYYGNGLPHVGHFYSSTIADIIHRYYKISGYTSRFTTWIDENSQKAVIKAQEEWKDIMQYLDDMAVAHKNVWDYFGMDYTDFIRTTEHRHHALVQEVLQHCYDKGDIYQGVYEGMYCIWCEAFKKDDDLVFLNKTTGETFPITPKIVASDNIIKVCPDHLKTPDMIKEKNYFFKLSRYQNWIEEFYQAHPHFVIPQFRFNEVIAFAQRGLEDFSISRETNTFGIPLPFDNSQVTYVWFDALFNYYTSAKYSRAWDKNNTHFTDESDAMWPADLHIVGKDIIRFHAIFWPAMLASYFDLWEQGSDGILHFKNTDAQKLPKNILTGWFFTVDGQKMSKSLWNVIEPVEYSKEYSQELLTLYMLSAFPIWNDGNYDRTEAIKTFNAKLANNLGNLVNRVVVLSLKLTEKSGILDTGLHNTQVEAESYAAPDMWNLDGQVHQESINLSASGMQSYAHMIELKMKQYNLKSSLDLSFEFLDLLNKFADEKQPWVTIKDDEQSTREVLYTLAEWLRQVGLALYSFFPEKMSEMFVKLGLQDYSNKLQAWELISLREKQEVFTITEKWNPLFQRLEV